jgi:hypothetical protein
VFTAVSKRLLHLQVMPFKTITLLTSEVKRDIHNILSGVYTGDQTVAVVTGDGDGNLKKKEAFLMKLHLRAI